MDEKVWPLAEARRDKVEDVLRTDHLEGRRPRWWASEGPYQVDCYRDGSFEELEHVSRRTIDVLVRVDNLLIGAAKFHEWSVGSFATPHDFWWAADGTSLEESEMAHIVASYWDYMYDWPCDYGSIVLFQRLGILSSEDRGRRALSIVRWAFEREFKRRASMMLMKAFPLEFEHTLAPDIRASRFPPRLSAMMRWYRLRLGVEPFVDQEAFSGWMWRPIRHCPAPSRSTPDLSWIEEL